MFNEPISPPLSSNPCSPPYFDLTSNTEHSDPTSQNHEKLWATADSEKIQFVPKTSKTILEPSIPEHSEPLPETSEPTLTRPTLDEALTKFSLSSASRLKKLSDESSVNENPSRLRTH